MEDNGLCSQSWQPKTCGWLTCPSIVVLWNDIMINIAGCLVSKGNRWHIDGQLPRISWLFTFLFCLFLTERAPPPSPLCRRAHPAPPQTLWGGGVWRGSRPDTPHLSALHPPVSTTCGCAASRTLQHTWVLTAALAFSWKYNGCRCTSDTNGDRDAVRIINVCLLCTVCVQHPDVRGGDAVRTIPSVMEGQGESCWCSVCWHWPSGLEVRCFFAQIPGQCHLEKFMSDYCNCMQSTW